MILQIGNKLKRGGIGRERSLVAQRGLTLIEVLMAVSILAIGIIGVLRAYAGSITTLEIGQNNIEAVLLLKEKIADVKLMILEDGETALSSDSGSSGDFLWQWEISPTEIENFNELTLTVSHNYNPRIFSLKTYVVDPEEEEQE